MIKFVSVLIPLFLLPSMGIADLTSTTPSHINVNAPTLDPITTIGTPRAHSWPPYASLYSGSQYFYSPPNYGKELGRPPKPQRLVLYEKVKQIEEAPYSQKFSGFSNRRPPLAPKRFFPVPPVVYTTEETPRFTFDPKRITPKYFESDSAHYEAGYDSPLYSGTDSIPVYKEPILTPIEEIGLKDNKDSNEASSVAEGLKVYDMYFHNDGKPTKSPGQYSLKLPEFKPQKPANRPYSVPQNRPMIVRGKFRGPMPHRFRGIRGPSRRPPVRYFRPDMTRDHPRYRPLRRFKGKFGAINDGFMEGTVRPSTALAVLVPLGLALSVVLPTALAFIGKRKRRRKRSLKEIQWNHTLDMMTRFGGEENMRDRRCLQRILCEAIVEVKHQPPTWRNLASKLVHRLLLK